VRDGYLRLVRFIGDCFQQNGGWQDDIRAVGAQAQLVDAVFVGSIFQAFDQQFEVFQAEGRVVFM
jgi:hypothetical protein